MPLCVFALVSGLATAGFALPLELPDGPTYSEPDFEFPGMDLSDFLFRDDGLNGYTRGFHVEGGIDVEEIDSIAAHGSNPAGLIVGEMFVESGSSAFVWQSGHGLIDLGDLPGGETSAVARAVNAAGQVVGRGRTADGDRAFVWDDVHGMRDLGRLIGVHRTVILLDATDIDGDGRITGRATVDGVEQAFLWTPETGLVDFGLTTAAPSPLHILEARRLEASGPVVGRALSEDGRDRPVVWLPGTAPLDLGDLPGGPEFGMAYDMNVFGRIVGRSATEDGYRAFVWDADEGMIDLNGLVDLRGDVVLTAAVSIIDDGSILAYGHNGTSIHFYRLLPVLDADGPWVVPSPQLVDLVQISAISAPHRYVVVDLGEFVTSVTATPILSMDETGRVVGACDLLAAACPRLATLAAVTNLFTEARSLPGPLALGFGDAFDGGGVGVTALTGGDIPLVPPGDGSTRPGLIPNDRTRTNGRTNPSIPPFLGGGPTTGPTDPPNTPSPTVIAPVPLPPSGMALLAALGLLAWSRRRPGAAA